MPRYTVQHRYFAVDNGRSVGPFEPGSTVELEEDRAAWVNRDSPGTLEPVVQPTDEQKPVTETVDEPDSGAAVEEPEPAATPSTRRGGGRRGQQR